MSDERFFQTVKSSLHDYQPAVDASVYSGMRRKLWWSNFTKLNFARFNMYYLILMLLGTGAVVAYNNQDCQADDVATHAPAAVIESTVSTHAPSASAAEVHDQTSIQKVEQPATVESRTNDTPGIRNRRVNNCNQYSSSQENAASQPQNQVAENQIETAQPETSISQVEESVDATESAANQTVPADQAAEPSKAKNGKRGLKVPVPKDKNASDH